MPDYKVPGIEIVSNVISMTSSGLPVESRRLKVWAFVSDVRGHWASASPAQSWSRGWRCPLLPAAATSPAAHLAPAAAGGASLLRDSPAGAEREAPLAAAAAAAGRGVGRVGRRRGDSDCSKANCSISNYVPSKDATGEHSAGKDNSSAESESNRVEVQQSSDSAINKMKFRITKGVFEEKGIEEIGKIRKTR
ncbi:hypothetical protein OsI_02941 [Oryza sativa Indica Group]|uniref:Uncharacterized protein n=1 Tax=Oryza sativa subsp. indica TaxID=39946 RepID=B8AC03_ORYSI|nr:hypothetical protein OsI_02941 [Oryza sativa Indica Group]